MTRGTLQREINHVASWNFHTRYCKLYLGHRLSNFHWLWVKASHAACSCCLRTARFLFCGTCSPGCPSVAVHISKTSLEAVSTFVLIYCCLGGRYLFPVEKIKPLTLQSVVRTERQREKEYRSPLDPNMPRCLCGSRRFNGGLFLRYTNLAQHGLLS